MKLIKIGSANSCNLIIHSNYVSSMHAELLLTDDGQIYLEDKNSTNGTFVGNKKIIPNERVRIQRGDLVKFGDTELSWNAIPQHYGPKKNEVWYNVGSSDQCQIPVSSQFVSRFHAILKVRDKKKAFLMDNDSRNGTMVNGNKLARNKEVQIKRKDSVICGDIDVSDDLKPYIPNRYGPLKPIMIAVAIAAVLCGLFFLLQRCDDDWIKKYKNAVVYVDAAYHYEVVFEDLPISKDVWKDVYKSETWTVPVQLPYSATAFFVDKNGVMVTNRHVANPGEYQDDVVKTAVRNSVHERIQESITVKRVTSDADLARLASTQLGSCIVAQWYLTGNGRYSNLNSLITAVMNTKFQIKGVLDYITVGYPGRNYTHADEYERCFVLDESGTPDQDVALLQLNTKRTPDNIKNIIDIKRMSFDGKFEPQKDPLTWIGYPRGNNWNLDAKTHSLEPEIRSTNISKTPSLYSFEVQGEAIGGASGSPVFNPKTGKLYGILFGNWRGGTTYSHACKVKCAKDLYEKNLPVIQQ